MMMNAEQLTLTQEWDKTFPKSDKVNHSKVTFVNHFGITLAADLYVPKEASGKLPAIAVSGLSTRPLPVSQAASHVPCILRTLMWRISRQR